MEKYINYDLKDTIQILEAEEFSKIKQQWYDNTSNLPNPVNEPNIEKELEELTESFLI